MKKIIFLLSFLSVQFIAFANPDNDSICNATPISVSLGCTEGTNIGATISEVAFVPTCWGGSAISNDVWYKFVATVSGMTVTTDVQGLSLTNTQIAVYATSDNTCTGNLTQVGCNDDGGTNVANNSIINMASLVAGNTYFIRVDGAGSATGTFCINVSDTYIPGSTPCEAQVVHPNNLSCEVPSQFNRADNGNRINNAVLPVGYYHPLGVNYCGGDDETNQYGTWSTFIANNDSVSITNQVTGANSLREYTLFLAANATDCSNLTCVGSDSAASLASITFSNLSVGTKYFILTTLTKNSTQTGFRTDYCAKSAVGLTPPANDLCANAQPINAEQLYLVSTYSANGDTPPDLCLGQADNTIWYSWTVPANWTGDAFFQLYQQNCTGGDGSRGSQISVYAPGVTCGDVANCVGGATGGSSVNGSQTDNNINAVWTPSPSATYLIAYDGFAHEVCDMRFQITNKASTNDITVNSTEICPGETATLTASGGSSYLWDTGETTASITVKPLITTSYNVSSTSGKIGSAVGFVIVKPIPSLKSTLNTTACSDQPFNYTPESTTSGTTFLWNRAAVAGVSNILASGNGNINETLSDTTLSAIKVNYVVISTANGCTNAPNGDTLATTVMPPSTIPNTATVICNREIFNIKPQNGIPTLATKIPVGTKYIWSAPTVNPAGTVTGGSANAVAIDSISQKLTNLTYNLSTVTYTVTPTLSGCSGIPFVLTVTVRPSDNATFNYALSTYCQNDTTADTIAHVTGLIGGTFKSTTGLILDASTGKFNLAASTLGTYNVTYITNGTCIDSSTFKITITLAPNATFSYPKLTYCQVATPFTSPTYTVGASAGIFTSNPAGVVFVSNQTGEIDINNTPSGAYAITNTIAAAGICLATAHTFTVTINPAPIMTNTITAKTICSGSPLSVPLTANMLSLIVWTNNNNSNIEGESTGNKIGSPINDALINTSLVPQIINYTITPTSNPQGCRGKSQFIDVTVNPKPVITSSNATQSICSGTAIHIPLTTNISSSFSWIPSINNNITGQSVTATISNTLTNTLTNISTAGQLLTYSITPNSNLGCAGNSQLITVRVNPKPKLTSDSALEICSEQNATLTLVANVNSTYTWIGNDIKHVGGEIITLQKNKTIDNILTNDTVTTQIVTYTATATSTIGICVSDQQLILVSVNPKPKMTSIDSVVICSGIPLNIKLLSNVPSAYLWVAANNANTNGEFTSAQPTPTIINSITNNTLIPQIVTYSVTPTATIGSCIGTVQTIKATVNPNPNMTSINAKLICGNGTPPNIALTANIAATYLWLTTDNTSLTGESIAPKMYDTINDVIVNTTINKEILTYTVTPISKGGSCTGISQEVTVTVAKPIATFTNDKDNGTPPLLINFTNNSQNATTYQWIYGDDAIDTTTNATHTYKIPKIYTVKLIASNNNVCSDTTTTTLIVYKLVVSNVFTPNGDGNNDFFEINHTGITSFDIEIYDRWGNKLYEGHTPNSKWDGRNSNGKNADDGTYYYLVKAKGIDGQEYSEKGFLTIIH